MSAAKTTRILSFNNHLIGQRVRDGYVNATAMCRAAGKKLHDYTRSTQTQAFLAHLSIKAGIPALELLIARPGGSGHSRGTWVHPRVAVNLAQWLSPEFAAWASDVLVQTIEGQGEGNGGAPITASADYSRMDLVDLSRHSNILAKVRDLYSGSQQATWAQGELDGIGDALMALPLDDDRDVTRLLRLGMAMDVLGLKGRARDMLEAAISGRAYAPARRIAA